VKNNTDKTTENDLKIEEIEIDPDDYGFSDEDFEVSDHRGHKVRRGRRKPILQYVIIGIVVSVIVFLVIKVAIWDKGQASEYDPNEDTSQYDIEPTDYIQPLSAKELEGKTDDGRTVIMTLGNSPFADDFEDNNLARELAKAYDAEVINGGLEESYITLKNSKYDPDYEEDGVSLVNVVNALVTGDFSIVSAAAAEISDGNVRAVDRLKAADMTKVDAIFIMYNLEDYRDHRPLGSEKLDDPTSIYGALFGAIKAIQEAYPYIRIIVLSQPAGGVTVDGFFVDGDIYDIGCGTLSDYVQFEIEPVASRGASFVDVYYGAINVDQRDKYLKDDYHINDAGAKAVADRVKKLVSLQ